MPRARFSLTVAAGLILATAGSASAYPPNGDLDVIIGEGRAIRPNAAGDVDALCTQLAGGFEQVDACDADVSSDGKGRISGFVTLTGSNDGLLYSLAGPLKGSQRGDDRSGLTSVTYTIKLSGEASDASRSLAVKGNSTLDLEIDSDRNATGTWQESLCVQGATCQTRVAPITDWPVTSGRWWLALTLWDSGGGALGGNAKLRFEGDPLVCSYTSRGRYDAKSDAASVRLTSTSPECAATTLQLKNLHLDREITGEIRYALFGRRGQAALEAAATRFDDRYPFFGGASFSWTLDFTIYDSFHFPEF